MILLHGFPYDVRAFDDVTPALVDAGCRVIVPFLRGFGATRFLSESTLRSGQQAVLAHDLLALIDALAIPRAVLAGYDWGGRAVCIVAAQCELPCLQLEVLIPIIGSYQGSIMDTARLFQTGRSQAVRLPKAYRFKGEEVVVRHFGNGVLLLPVNEPWGMIEAAIDAFEPGFKIGRDQPPEQSREDIAP